MVLPDGDLRTTEENVLSSSGLGILLLDLDFANVGRMLNDLGDVGLVLSTDLSCDSLGEVNVSSVHPVLPENTNGTGSNTNTVRSKIGLNHTEGSVDGPEDEEDDEHVVGVPEALKVRTSHLFDRSNHHTHQSSQHDVSSPSWASDKVGHKPSSKTQIILRSNLRKVVPMRKSVYPREEDNRPSGSHVECNVFVELDDTIERRLSSERNECPANREQNHSHIEMQR